VLLGALQDPIIDVDGRPHGDPVSRICIMMQPVTHPASPGLGPGLC
jgi:hypothetical protein